MHPDEEERRKIVNYFNYLYSRVLKGVEELQQEINMFSWVHHEVFQIENPHEYIDMIRINIENKRQNKSKS